MSFISTTPHDVALALRDRFKVLRLARNLTRPGLAERAGINFHSLKRFEETGFIAFESLLKIALVLGCLEDFNIVGRPSADQQRSMSLDAVLAQKPKRGRGRLT